MQLKVQPKRYLSYISSSSEEILGQIEVVNATASSRYDKKTRTRGEKVRIKFCRRMKFFLAEGGSCSYDYESIGDIDVPLRYKHLVKHCVFSMCGGHGVATQHCLKAYLFISL